MKTRKKTHGGARRGAGRPRKFATPAVARSLHLPEAFWAILEAIEGSRSEAFTVALRSEKIVRQLRRTLLDD